MPPMPPMKVNQMRIEHIANSTSDWKLCVELAWSETNTITDWSALEATLRAYVRSSGNKNVDEIIAAFTGRGHEGVDKIFS